MSKDTNIKSILTGPVLLRDDLFPLSFAEFEAVLPYVTITAVLTLESITRVMSDWSLCLATRDSSGARGLYIEPYVHAEGSGFRHMRTDRVKSFLRVNASSALTNLIGQCGPYPCISEMDLARIIRMSELLCMSIIKSAPSAPTNGGVNANLLKSFCTQFSSFVLPSIDTPGTYDAISVQKEEVGNWLVRGVSLDDLRARSVNRLLNRDSKDVINRTYNQYMIDYNHRASGLWQGSYVVSPALVPYWDETKGFGETVTLSSSYF